MNARPSGRRQQVARLLEATGVLGALGVVRRRVSSGITLLAYHRVLDVPDEDAFPGDIELVSASVAQFAEQMRFVKTHYRATTFAALLADLDAGRPIAPATCLVTFDDGFADNYHHAFPVLRALGLPATIFLSTGFIDRQEVFWYERLAHAVLASTQAGATAVARRAALAGLLKGLKRLPDAERRARVESLVADHAPAGIDAMPTSAPLTWEQVREMAAGGIEFGSHTVDHPVLSRLEPAALRAELGDSRARIQAMTGQPVDVIAYPVGGQDAFNPGVQRAVREAGYRLGVSYMPGVESPDRWDPYAIRRLPVERYVDGTRFRAMLASPGLFI